MQYPSDWAVWAANDDGSYTYYLNAQGDLFGLGGDLAGLLQYC